jgi:hypothetical protein
MNPIDTFRTCIPLHLAKFHEIASAESDAHLHVICLLELVDNIRRPDVTPKDRRCTIARSCLREIAHEWHRSGYLRIRAIRDDVLIPARR